MAPRGQSRSGSARRRVGPSLDSSAPSGALLTSADFTYLGAYSVPRSPPSCGDSTNGNALALRYENTDGTNPVHLLSCGFNSTPNHLVYEWRDATPANPGSPTVLSNYTDATVMASYGDIYSRKLIIYNGTTQPMTAQLDGDLGLYWDDTDSRLYWSYGFGYSSDTNSWCIGYSTLNYGAVTGTGHGPWGFTGQSWKAMMAGLVGVPSAYATTYLSGQRLAVGMGGYYSLIASCDCSLGPSLTALTPIPGAATEQTYLSCTPLMGYWPYVDPPDGTHGHCNRPENRIANATSEYNVDSWPIGKFSWNDRVRAGVWIDNGVKRGVVFFGSYGRDYTQYVSSTIPSTKQGHYWAIYDPNGFVPVSGANYYAIQPASIYNYQYPTIDYTQSNYTVGGTKAVSSITSTNGVLKSDVAGAVVNCTGHGFSNGNYVQILGASAEYSCIWTIPSSAGVIDANTFNIQNTSFSDTWDGITSTGTITAQLANNSIDRIFGAVIDPTTNKLYVAVSVQQGVNNANGKVMIHVYQVAH